MLVCSCFSNLIQLLALAKVNYNKQWEKNALKVMILVQKSSVLIMARMLKMVHEPDGICVQSFSRVPLCVILWTAAHQAPLSMGFSRQEYLEWVAISFSRRSSQPRNRTLVSPVS